MEKPALSINLLASGDNRGYNDYNKRKEVGIWEIAAEIVSIAVAAQGIWC